MNDNNADQNKTGIPQVSDSEVRAFIYQQLSDLEAILPLGSEIDVQISDPVKSEEDFVEASIQVKTEDGDLDFSIRGKDEFDAIKSAVSGIKEEIVREMPLTDSESIMDARDDLVDAIIDKNYLH